MMKMECLCEVLWDFLTDNFFNSFCGVIVVRLVNLLTSLAADGISALKVYWNWDDIFYL